MKEVVEAVGAAWPLVTGFALVIWALVAWHGDERWLAKKDAVNPDGNVKWATSESHKTLEALVLGQNEKLADHETRIAISENQNAEKMETLRGISETMSDMRDRIVRMEARQERRRASDG